MRSLALCTVAAVALAGCDNYIIDADQNVNMAWGNLQSQYQRRMDLIPNLVETVKGAADFERNTLQAVIGARSAAVNLKLDEKDLSDAQKVQQFQQAQSAIASNLRQLFAVS